MICFIKGDCHYEFRVFSPIVLCVFLKYICTRNINKEIFTIYTDNIMNLLGINFRFILDFLQELPKASSHAIHR